MKHIVIDFEMQHGEMQLLQSAPNVYQTEIIEIGAVMLNDESNSSVNSRVMFIPPMENSPIISQYLPE